MAVEVEKLGPIYTIKYSGPKNRFPDYMNKLNKIPGKSFNSNLKSWTFPSTSIDVAIASFRDINFLEEVQPESLSSGFQCDVVDLNLPLRQYQKDTVGLSLSVGSPLIILPCGAGKTPIGISSYISAIESAAIKGPGIIVTKASLKLQWQREIHKFSNLSANAIYTSAQIKGMKFKDQFRGANLYVVNYETLRDSKVKSEIHKLKPAFIFADEVQYVKNHKAKRSEALYEFADVPIRMGATATAVTRAPEDLFGIFKFLQPSIFPTWNHFAQKYIIFNRYGQPVNSKNIDHLARKIAPFVVVKSKEEVSKELPSLVVLQRSCEPTNAQLSMHANIMDEVDALRAEQAEAGEDEAAERIGNLINALFTFDQELADDPRLLDMSDSEMSKQYSISDKSSPKLEMLSELVEDIIGSEEKVCIFTKYERMQRLILESLNSNKSIKSDIAVLNGSTPIKQRDRQVYDLFRDTDSYKILLATNAGAEGLNLSKCKYIIEYDLADSFAVQTQRHGRVERADSIHGTVFVYQLINEGTYDNIQQHIIKKKEKFDIALFRQEDLDA